MAFNLLITSSGGIRTSDLIYQIRRKSIYRPIKIHTTDIKKNVKNQFLADSFNQVPKPEDSQYIKKMISIIKKNSIELVIPRSDEEAVKLSKAKKKLNKFGTNLACVDYKYLKFFKDKLSTYKKLDKLRIRKPIWKKVLNLKQLNLVVEKFTKKKGEVVIKPAFSRGGRDVTIIRNNFKKKIILKNYGREKHVSKDFFFNHENKKYLKKFPVIIMERLFEPTYDIDLLAWNGKLIKYVLRRRIGAQGIKGNIIEKNKKDFKIYAQKIAKAFNLSWLYDCDIMLDKNSKPVLIELNPRISGSLYASLAAGIPLIDDLISLSKKKFSKIRQTTVTQKILIRPRNKFKN
tara:strand:- start:1488 stop:2525 length:1038 start_codon:yes stop_codon:yes gene_type:complete